MRRELLGFRIHGAVIYNHLELAEVIHFYNYSRSWRRGLSVFHIFFFSDLSHTVMRKWWEAIAVLSFGECFFLSNFFIRAKVKSSFIAVAIKVRTFFNALNNHVLVINIKALCLLPSALCPLPSALCPLLYNFAQPSRHPPQHIKLQQIH